MEKENIMKEIKFLESIVLQLNNAKRPLLQKIDRLWNEYYKDDPNYIYKNVLYD